MSKKKNRIDVNATPEPLTDNPFAALADAMPKDLPARNETVPKEIPKAEIMQEEALPYTVGRTRKGGYDITFERRAKGKGVTVLRRVSGDGEALLKKLKKQCGAGGACYEDHIELQGDHRGAIEKLLRQ